MIKENNSRKQIIQSDSVKSLASPPPKKHEKDSKPKENPKKKELQANKHEKDSKPEGRGVRGGGVDHVILGANKRPFKGFEKIAWGGDKIQDDTDIATNRPKRPKGRFGEKTWNN